MLDQSPDGFGGDPDELDEVLEEWTEWFDPNVGWSAMYALADHIKANPDAAECLENPADVIAELEELARVLKAAASQGIRFRLQLS